MTTFKPLDPQPSKLVQFICESYPNGGGIATNGEAGYYRFSSLSDVIEHLFSLQMRGFVIYSMLEGAKITDATAGNLWEVYHWNGRVSYYKFAKKIKIFPLSSISQDPDSVWPFFLWLREIGVSPASFTAMARASWRRTFTRPVSFFDEAQLGRLALYGNRKEA